MDAMQAIERENLDNIKELLDEELIQSRDPRGKNLNIIHFPLIQTFFNP